MATIKRFEDIAVWKKAREFSTLAYKITEQELFRRDYGLKDQIRRAAVSIASNIAEGFERNGNKEFIYFLRIGKGSAGEVRTQLYIALDLNYITKAEFGELHDKITEVSKMLSGMINYLKQLEVKRIEQT